MAFPVAMGAVMTCSFGVAPSSLVLIPPAQPIMGPAGLLGTIMDNKPIANVPPFGMCTTPSNPTVAAATAAALGVLTPMPCVPVTSAPWIPGSPTVLMGAIPALNSNCKLMCNWGGVIQFTVPNTPTIQVPG